MSAVYTDAETGARPGASTPGARLQWTNHKAWMAGLLAAVVPIALQNLLGTQAVFLDTINKYVAAARLPVGPKRTAELKAADRSLDGRDDLEAKAVRHVIPALMKIGETDTRTAALCRLTAVACACERFRLKTGQFPNTLAELPNDLLAAVPADPYTDEPLRYKLTDTGAVVYCTGPDKTDDGGKQTHRQGPPDGFDLTFRLYLPLHRSLPPPASKINWDHARP